MLRIITPAKHGIEKITPLTFEPVFSNKRIINLEIPAAKRTANIKEYPINVWTTTVEKPQ